MPARDAIDLLCVNTIRTLAWRVIVNLRHEPVCLILSSQNMPTLDRTKYASASGVARGAYVLADAAGGKPDVILIGTGSEVSLCVDAYERLTQEGIKARVVSMPSWELFEQQSYDYQHRVLPPAVRARVSVEQASVFGWDRYARRRIGMHTFGASAPLKELQKKIRLHPRRCSRCRQRRTGKGTIETIRKGDGNCGPSHRPPQDRPRQQKGEECSWQKTSLLKEFSAPAVPATLA